MQDQPPFNPWDALESIRRLVALPQVWEEKLGPHFRTFKTLCLQESSKLAQALVCPRGCGCLHTVIPRHDGHGGVAICRCEPPRCPDLPVTLEEITPLEVNRTRLARALGKALGCHIKISQFKLPETYQFGAWSVRAVPAILTIQSDPAVFRSVLAELVARLRRTFILFAPTSDHFSAECQELLANVQAQFFAIDSTLMLTLQGSLVPVRPPAELFATLADPAAPAQPSARPPPLPPYALRKGLGVWHLSFEGKEADIKHQRAVFYVAYLLTRPPEKPLHALDLVAKIPEIYRQQLGLMPLADPVSGEPVCLESHARLQQRNLALDDAQAARSLLRLERRLQAVLDSSDQSEPAKAEALRELDAIAQFRRRDAGRSKDSAQTAANTVRRAIHRFHQRLRGALDSEGNPHPVLTRFGDYIQRHILIPSARYSGHGGPYARRGVAGCFTHEPPEDVRWG